MGRPGSSFPVADPAPATLAGFVSTIFVFSFLPKSYDPAPATLAGFLQTIRKHIFIPVTCTCNTGHKMKRIKLSDDWPYDNMGQMTGDDGLKCCHRKRRQAEERKDGGDKRW